jgi:hypothetical protein
MFQKSVQAPLNCRACAFLLVFFKQEHLNAGTVEVCLMGSENAATPTTYTGSHAASTSPASAALAARWQLAGPPALAAAERHGPSLVLRCLDLCCGGGPEPLVEPAACALHGLLSAKRSGVSAAARYACQQHLPSLLHARLPPSAQDASPLGHDSATGAAVSPAEAVVVCLCREGSGSPSLGAVTAISWCLWRCANGKEAPPSLLAFARY